jgi:hypothetical protein
VNISLPNELTLLSAFAVFGGLYFFIRGFRVLARKRLLINTPTSKIRSASLGLVEVSGVVKGAHTLRSPIAGIPCFLYQTTAWQKSDESRTGEWKKVAEETLHVPFFVDDSTGKFLVHPEGAELDLHRDFCQNYSETIFSPHAGSETLSFLARHGVAPNDKIRVEERAIRPETALFVVGTLAENPDFQRELSPAKSQVRLTSSVSEVSPQIIRLSDGLRENGESELSTSTQSGPQHSSGQQVSTQQTSSQQAKIAAALTRAGITNPAAWEVAGVSYCPAELPRVNEIAVRNEGSRAMSHPEPDEFDPNQPVVLMKGKNDTSFLISWRSQHELVRALAWKSMAMIWLGAGVALLGVYMLLAQFGL